MQPMEIPIPVCPLILPSLCLPGFPAQSWFPYPARSTFCPPTLPVWSTSSGHTLTLRSSTNLSAPLLCFTLFLSASTYNSPHDFLSLLFPRHIIPLYSLLQLISQHPTIHSPGPSPFGFSYNPSLPLLLLATVLHFTAFSNSLFPKAPRCGQVPFFIAVSWSKSRPLPLHTWILPPLLFNQVVFSSCCWDPAQGSLRLQQKQPLFTVPRIGPGSFYSCNNRIVSLSSEQGTRSLHGQQLMDFRC